MLGLEGLQRASVQKVRRSGDPGEGPHLHAPGGELLLLPTLCVLQGAA